MEIRWHISKAMYKKEYRKHKVMTPSYEKFSAMEHFGLLASIHSSTTLSLRFLPLY
jgi:hypothetical protein